MFSPRSASMYEDLKSEMNNLKFCCIVSIIIIKISVFFALFVASRMMKKIERLENLILTKLRKK